MRGCIGRPRTVRVLVWWCHHSGRGISGLKKHHRTQRQCGAAADVSFTSTVRAAAVTVLVVPRHTRSCTNPSALLRPQVPAPRVWTYL